MKKIVVLSGIMFLLFSCSSQDKWPNLSIAEVDTTTMIQQRQFKAYEGCTLEDRTGAWLKLKVQNCTIKWKWLTVNPSETLPWYFIEINSGSGFVAQELALQVLSIGDYPDRAAGVKKLEEYLKSQSYIPQNGCILKKDEWKSKDNKKVFRLVVEEWKKDINCGDYADINPKNQRYFILYDTTKKIVFVNQRKSKRLFDENTIEFIK